MSEMTVPREYELMSGVTLSVYPTDRFKVGLLSLSLLLPLEREQSHIRTLLFSVLRRGNEAYPTLEAINRRLDELYATPYRVRNRELGQYQCLGFSADLLGERYLPEGTDLLGGVLSMMEQMLFHPLQVEGLLTERYVDAEKKNTVDAIRSIKNHASAYANAQLLERFYEGAQGGHLLCGTENEVTSVSIDVLTEAWHEMLRTAPIRCFYVGPMAGETVAKRLGEMLTDAFEGLGRPRAVLPLVKGCLPMLPARSTPQRFDTEHPSGQCHLLIGVRTGITCASPEFYAMRMCHEILGLSPISRLFVHVREKHGLCYSCASEYHIEHGDIIIRCGISEQNRELAERAILEQLDVMRRGEFDDAEWNAAKKSLENSYRQVEDSTRSIANFYELRAVLGVDQTPDSCRARFAALTREQVIAAAQHLTVDTILFQRGTDDGDGEEEGMDDV